jgi:hypothetical protein
MKTLLMIAALAEAATGVILLAYPPIVVRLLFASDITGAGVIMSRLAGVSLIALGVACWPDVSMVRAFYGMLTYSALALLYLTVVGLGGQAGILLWPGVAVHAALIALLTYMRSAQANQAQ